MKRVFYQIAKRDAAWPGGWDWDWDLGDDSRRGMTKTEAVKRLRADEAEGGYGDDKNFAVVRVTVETVVTGRRKYVED